MHGTAGPSAIRAAPARARATRIDVEKIKAARRDRLNAAAWHGTKLVHTLFYGRQERSSQTSVPPRHNPRKVRKTHRTKEGSAFTVRLKPDVLRFVQQAAEKENCSIPNFVETVLIAEKHRREAQASSKSETST